MKKQQRELQKLLENAGLAERQLNEYIVREGGSFDEIFNLNLFSETEEGQFISDYDEEFAASDEWRAIEQKYAVIARELSDRIHAAADEGRTLSEEEADELDDVAYDGSDAYESVEMAMHYLVPIWDAQIDAVEAVLDGEVGMFEASTEQGVGPDEYDQAIGVLAKYAIEMAEKHFGSGQNRSQSFQHFAVDRDMMDTVLSMVKHDLVDTMQHIMRFKK